jgi:hypothetical protein
MDINKCYFMLIINANDPRICRVFKVTKWESLESLIICCGNGWLRGPDGERGQKLFIYLLSRHHDILYR